MNKKISQLDPLVVLSGAELVPVIHNGLNYKVSLNDIVSLGVGAVGPTGPQGDPGVQGDPGPQGPTGPGSPFDTDIVVNGVDIGRGAGTGDTATRVGFSALGANTTGWYNTSIGYLSMAMNTTGSQNTVLGGQALKSNTAGGNNVAVGDTTLYNNTTGTENTGVGARALAAVTAGIANIGVGFQSGGQITTGSYNVVIGANLGNTIATSNNNIILSDGMGNIRATSNNAGVFNVVGSLTVNGNAVGGPRTTIIPITCSDETTALTAGAGKISFSWPIGFTLTGVHASLKTAQTAGAIFTVDVNIEGVSILSTKLTIDNNEKTSGTAAIPPVILGTTVAYTAFTEFTIDIDQIGTSGAAGLKVYLIGTM